MAVTRTGFSTLATFSTSTALSVTASSTASSGTLPLTAGDWLLCKVTANATTSVQPITTTSTGWYKLNEANKGDPGPSAVAFFAKKALGSDAMPTFVSTASGAVHQIACILEEFTGADPAFPFITTGFATGTTTTITATTIQNVPASGCFATGTQTAFQSSATTNTFTAGTNFTADLTDGTTSQQFHTAHQSDSSPSSGSTLAMAGSWGSTTADRAAMVVVVQPPVSHTGLYEDASQPPPIYTTTNASTPGATTASFSPPAGSLVVAIVQIFWAAAESTGTLSVSDSASVSYTAGPQTAAGSSSDTMAGIFTHYYASAPGSITVSCSNSNTAAGAVHLVVRVLNNAATSQAGAGSVAIQGAGSTALTDAITTTQAGSIVYVSGTNGDRQAGMIQNAATFGIDQSIDNTEGRLGMTGESGPTVTPGSTTLGWTQSSALAFTWAALEILPAAATTATLSMPGQAVQSSVPQVFPRGRVRSSAGAPLQNPVQGPVFQQVTQAVSIPFLPLLPRAGRIASNPGAPVANPVKGPKVYALLGPVAARFPQWHPRSGRTSGNPGDPVRNPTPGPVFTSRPRPVQASRPLPGRGRIWFSPGGPVQNPPPPGMGPVFFPLHYPARAHPSPPPRGRSASNSGGPVRNATAGPVFIARITPAQAQRPYLRKGRIWSLPGTPVAPPVPPAAFSPLSRALQAKLPLARRGIVRSNPGAPVQNATAGPVFRQAIRALRAKVALRPPAGRSGGISSGAPVVNPAPPFEYIFIGHYPVGYFDYVDTNTEEILEVFPGGGYLMAVVSGRPGLTVPPSDGRWLGSPGIGDEVVFGRIVSPSERASEQLQAARELNARLQAQGGK